MNNYKDVRRGDVCIADLGMDGIGCEQQGKRPVLILQNDVGNFFSPTVTIVPITSSLKKKDLPTHYVLQHADFMNRTSMLLAESVRTIDKRRLGRIIGHLDEMDMNGAEEAIEKQLGFTIPDAVEAP